MTELTQCRVKELFDYNKDTGIFVRRVTVRGYNSQKGVVAGARQAKGYLVIAIDGKAYLSHRLAWLYVTGSFPEFQIDHINHSKTDNSFANLRDVGNQENHRNAPLQSNNKTGVTGVCWDNKRSKWLAFMKLNGKSKHLGGFACFVDAVIARKMAEYKYNYHANHGC